MSPCRIHFICKDRLHLEPVEFPVFESGFWPLSVNDAERLVGGMAYLHQAKAQPSYFGGKVKSYRVAKQSEPYPGRIVLSLESVREGKGAEWEGADFSMAYSGGIVCD